MNKIDIVYDMETSDPDDFFTLCFLTQHPSVTLRAVTVTPGTTEQIGLVRYVLKYTQTNIPVGGRNPTSEKYEKSHVSKFHYRFLKTIQHSDPDDIAHNVLAQTIEKYPNITVLTGAALHNLRLLFNNHPQTEIARWVGQGGFAGDNIVAPEHRLDKFAGRVTCPTFNFNGDVKGAQKMLKSPNVKKRLLVSKNVCHSIAYNYVLHEKVAQIPNKTPGMELIYKGMEVYLQKRSAGKLFHDPLAACVAIEPSICKFAEVELYREKGEWGSIAIPGSNTFISIAVDENRFHEVFLRL